MSTTKNRDELVAELTAFYEFLATLHIPADALKRPPPDGWADVNQDRLGFLNKDDEAMAVLRYIPFIRRDDDGGIDAYQIYEKTVANDFTGKFYERFAMQRKEVDCSEPYQEELDSCVVTLATSQSRDGWYILYHTVEHTIDTVDYQVGARKTYKVREFFEMLKEEYRTLKAFPLSPEEVKLESQPGSDDIQQIRDLLIRHGWPDNFEKEHLKDADALYVKLNNIG